MRSIRAGLFASSDGTHQRIGDRGPRSVALIGLARSRSQTSSARQSHSRTVAASRPCRSRTPFPVAALPRGCRSSRRTECRLTPCGRQSAVALLPDGVLVWEATVQPHPQFVRHQRLSHDRGIHRLPDGPQPERSEAVSQRIATDCSQVAINPLWQSTSAAGVPSGLRYLCAQSVRNRRQSWFT